MAPRLTQVAVLVDPQNPTWMMHVPTMEKAAPLFAVELTAVHVRDAAEIERSINSFAARPNTSRTSARTEGTAAHPQERSLLALRQPRGERTTSACCG